METTRCKMAKSLHTDRTWLREFFAEFLGTAFLVALGDGAVAQMVVRRRLLGEPFNDFLSVNLGYGLAIAFGVYICGGVSGGHINPAVSFTMCIFGRLSWRKLPVYWIGQYLGGFVGAAVLYVTYIDSFGSLDALSFANHTPGIYATYPLSFVSTFPAFLDQIVGAAVLLLCVFALTDPRNSGVPKHLVPLLVGLTVSLIGLCYGIQCGFGLNAARDFMPRLFSAVFYGADPFRLGGYFFWIPVVGSHVGALLGAAIYQGLIGLHWPPLHEEGPVVVTRIHVHPSEKPKEAVTTM